MRAQGKQRRLGTEQARSHSCMRTAASFGTPLHLATHHPHTQDCTHQPMFPSPNGLTHFLYLAIARTLAFAWSTIGAQYPILSSSFLLYLDDGSCRTVRAVSHAR